MKMQADRIYHATLKIGDAVIMGNDLPDQFEPPRGFSIVLQMDDAATAEHVFQALSEGGTVGINCERPAGPA